MASCPKGSKHRDAPTESRHILLRQLQPLLTLSMLLFQLAIFVFQLCNNLQSLLQLLLRIDHTVSAVTYKGNILMQVQHESDDHNEYA